MRVTLKKLALVLSLGLFMASCFPTRQSCGMAYNNNTVKKELVKTQNYKNLTTVK